MKRIFLIGYMGAGKTTMGKSLAQVMGLRFIDLDNFIEARHSKTIKEIFAEVGEEGFRQIERNMLHEVAETEDTVIAVGGGTPCFFDNMGTDAEKYLTWKEVIKQLPECDYFICDAQKGLLKAILEERPNAKIQICIFHI